jgi:hypothetical protein
MKDIEPVGFARLHADFVAVDRRVLGGELPSIAAPAQGVSRSGHLRWRIRHGIDSQPKAIKCSVFKSVEREIRDSTTRAICARFGVNPDTYWNRRAVVSEDMLEGILRVHRVVRKRLPERGRILLDYYKGWAGYGPHRRTWANERASVPVLLINERASW